MIWVIWKFVVHTRLGYQLGRCHVFKELFPLMQQIAWADCNGCRREEEKKREIITLIFITNAPLYRSSCSVDDVVNALNCCYCCSIILQIDFAQSKVTTTTTTDGRAVVVFSLKKKKQILGKLILYIYSLSHLQTLFIITLFYFIMTELDLFFKFKITNFQFRLSLLFFKQWDPTFLSWSVKTKITFLFSFNDKVKILPLHILKLSKTARLRLVSGIIFFIIIKKNILPTGWKNKKNICHILQINSLTYETSFFLK